MATGKNLKVFCIGMGKTGTVSLEAFLISLGLTAGDQQTGEHLLACWAARRFEEITNLANTAQFFQDIPFSCPFTYIAMDIAFPGSKFILTTRDNEEIWYSSLTRFHTQIVGKNRLPSADDLRNFGYIYEGWILDAMKLIFGVSNSAPYDKRTIIDVYLRHNTSIREYFQHRPGSMLEINISRTGAAKQIAEFLELPYDGQLMPHLNKSQ